MKWPTPPQCFITLGNYSFVNVNEPSNLLIYLSILILFVTVGICMGCLSAIGKPKQDLECPTTN